MNFIKKHYEKIILATFLLVFIFSLIWLIAVLSVSLDIKPEQLKLPYIKANYLPVKTTDYDIAKIFYSEHDWTRQNADAEDKSKPSADLLNPYKALRCIECQKIIPFSAYENEKCPACDAKLPKPNDGGGKPPVEGQDTDKAGIPDKAEKELGLDWNNPRDEFDDKDQDGFNNLSEYSLNTKLDDAKSHPPVALRLFVSKIQRRLLSMKLKKVVKSGDDKTKWEIQIEVKSKLKFFKIGGVIDYGPNDKFNVTDIVPKTVEVEDKRLKQVVSNDATFVVIQRDDDPPIEVLPGEAVYENKEKIYITDSATNKDYNPDSKGVFTVTGKNIEPETYTVVGATDAKNKKVKVKGKDGKEYELGEISRLAFLKLDKRDLPEEPEQPQPGPESMEMPGGGPPMGPMGPMPKQPQKGQKTGPGAFPAPPPMGPPGAFPGQPPMPPNKR